jgi:hypothetical protein
MLRAMCWIALAAVVLPALPSPKEARPSDWPLERFVRNLEARLRAESEDAGAHYTLGRVHAFAFALERSSLLGGGTEEFTWLKDLDEQRRNEAAPLQPPPTPEQRITHLREGVRHLQRACELEETALHRLTLAWLLELGAPLAEHIDPASLFGTPAAPPADREALTHWIDALGSPVAAESEEARRELARPETLERALPLLAERLSASDPGPRAALRAALVELLRRAWIERAIAAYRRSLELAETEGLLADPMIQGPASRRVPREALEAYRRLVRARGVQGPEEDRLLAEADARWESVAEQPTREWITPLLLALDECRTLADLTLPEVLVPFDLDGDGVDELWPWLAPGSGWLVWDPERRGEITSGRQLFGTASGWLFFEDGYRVLDALDDDRSGELRDGELTGIAVWFDRDTDGVSDRAEVVPVEELGIVALATESTLTFERSPANLCGLELADGRVLPTYDWVLAPVAP